MTTRDASPTSNRIGHRSGRRLHRRAVLGVGAAAAGAIAAACGPSQSAEPRPTTSAGTQPTTAAGAQQAQGRPGGTLRISTLGGLTKVFHPYPESQHNTTPHSDAWTLMGTGLIGIDWDKLDYVADPRRHMATAMPAVSNGNRTYTFTLRDNLKWSDGKPIVADDFNYAWEQASKSENNWVGFGTVVNRIESFRADGKTVTVTLKEPLSRLLALSIAGGIGPVPKHIWEGKSWLDAASNPELLKPTVVNGPYMPGELGAERHTFVKNPNWWGKAPNLNEVVMVSANPQTVLELLKTKQVEQAQSFPPALVREAKAIPHANFYEWAGAVGSYRVMQFNLQRPFLADKRVREALCRAINRQDLVQFEDDMAEPQFGLYPNKFGYANSAVEKYDFNVNRAKALLQEAGYTLQGNVLRDRSGQPVKLEILWPTTSAPRGKMATYAQGQWKELGIETTVTGMEFNAMVDRYQRQKDFDIVMGAFSQTGIDPDTINSQYKSDGTQNAGGYKNARVDELFAQGAAELDETKRRAIYNEIQKLVVDDLPVYPMLTLKTFTAFDKRVTGVVPLKGGDILRQNNLQLLDWALTS
jgi:peptide/nickel transport system substrate-binding protein